MPNITETTDAPAGAGTLYTLSMGGTARGTIASGDRDFYRVALVAGQSYVFSLAGVGVSNIGDTVLTLYAADGVSQLASNDDGLPGRNSQILYTAASTGVFYLDARGYGAGDVGQYALNAAQIGARPALEWDMAAGLIDADVSWSAAPGGGATVTWAARRRGPAVDADGVSATFAAFTATQIAAVSQILQSLSDVCGLRFQRVNDGDGYSDNASILFGNYWSASDGAGAYANYPGSAATNSEAGDIWANTQSVSTTRLPLSSYSYLTLLHEIGHAVGLSHPGLYNAAAGVTIAYAADAQFAQDSHQYTMMSYFDESSTGANFNGYASTPMLLDILSLQNIYGANMATRVTNTTYGFNANAGGPFDFAQGARAFSIWDAGGVDTLDGSGASAGQTIDLNPGGFSNMNGGVANVSVAFGVTMENAVGGAGADVIYGNAAPNWLRGGAGGDQLFGGDGDDALFGGDGVDILVGGAGNDVVSDLGAEVTWADGGMGDDVIETGRGSDHLFGGDGADRLRAGDHTDELIGGAGDDALISGESGPYGDFLAGGAGRDTYYFEGLRDFGDHITDWNGAEDVMSFYAAGLGGGLVAGQGLTLGYNLINNGGPVAAAATFCLKGNLVYYDADGTGAGAARLVAALWTNPGAVNAWNFAFY